MEKETIYDIIELARAYIGTGILTYYFVHLFS